MSNEILYYYSGSIASGLEKYVVKQNETKDVFLISFEDHDLDDIINIADDLIFVDAHQRLLQN